jgi:hypothetical protein
MSFDYDVFVSYRWVEPDQTWVRDEFVPALKSAGLTVCVDVEDFVPGRDLILEMSRAGKQSRRAICVLSPDYFEGNRMVGFESLMTRRSDPSGTESHLIPFVLRKCVMPDWLRGLIPIDWTNPVHHSREWRKLLKVLGAPRPRAKAPPPIADTNKARETPLTLASWDEAYRKTREDKRYTSITLWFEDESISDDDSDERCLVVDKEYYTTVKSLLDDIYMSHLHRHVPPYTYGSHWLLRGSCLVVPFNWIASPGTPIQDVDLDWVDNPLQDIWSFNDNLSLITNRAVGALIENGVYGVLVNDVRLAAMINSHPKSARYMLAHKDLFIKARPKKGKSGKYRFRLVYSVPAYRDLSGTVFVESENVAKTPGIIDPVWKRASRLA